MKRTLSALVVAFICHAACASPTPVPVRAEIDTLLESLVSSGCEFSRNGTWYSGNEAKNHLLHKLNYIEKYYTIENTEQFIDVAATKSSFSGHAYYVKCGDLPPVKSHQWLMSELAAQRAKGLNISPN